MHIGRFCIAGLCAAIAFASVLHAADVNNYRVTILVSNEPGEAPVIDSKLVNGWGIATAGSSPWWVSDNGTDWSTVYNGAGVKQSREVVVPGAPNRHGQLNSPWGVAMAPTTFGRFGGCLLVGNFGDGEINAYCQDGQGQFHHQGTLREDRQPLVIDGLWGIGFGNDGGAGSKDVLYFAAGPDEEENGYFGKVEFVP